MQELDLRVLLNVLLQRLKWIVLAAVILSMIMGGYTLLFVDETYSSTCSMYIMNLNSLDNGQASGNTGLSSSGLAASQQMVNEYIALLKSNKVIDDVAVALQQQGYTMSNKQIRSTLKMVPKDETALLEISCTTTDPILSKAICDALMDSAPEKVKQVMLELGTITPVDAASVGRRIGPSRSRGFMLGGVIGLVLSYGVFLLVYMLDNTVKSEQELKLRMDVTVLGAVPDLHPAQIKKGGKPNA